MFADDTSVFLPHWNLLTMYEQANELNLNVMKTKYILFRTPHSPPLPYIWCSKLKINRVSLVSFLGVEFQEHLSWKTTCKYIEQNQM